MKRVGINYILYLNFMKKFLVVFFTIALFSVKASFAQYYILGADATVVNTIDIDGNDGFYCEFVPSDDGYIMLSEYPTLNPWPHQVGVSYTLIDQNDNETGDTIISTVDGYAAMVDFPGFDWSNYKFIEIEWTSFDDAGYGPNGNYDDICDDFYIGS